jgi:hypothetical protein
MKGLNKNSWSLLNCSNTCNSIPCDENKSPVPSNKSPAPGNKHNYSERVTKAEMK